MKGFANRITSCARRAAPLAVLVAVVALGGCSSRDRVPLFADPALATGLEEQIVLMPVVDARADKFSQFEAGRHVRNAAARVLGRKGYEVVESGELGGTKRPPFDGFDGLSAKELSALAPIGSGTVLFVAVTHIEHEYTNLGDAYRVRMSGLLLDRPQQRILWRDTGIGTTNFGGFLQALAPAGSQYDAIYEGLVSMFNTVPDRPEARPLTPAG